MPSSSGVQVGDLNNSVSEMMAESIKRNAGADPRARRLRSRPGCCADLVLLQARDPIEALRLRATRLLVLRAGKVVAASPATVTTLNLPGRPEQIDFVRRLA